MTPRFRAGLPARTLFIIGLVSLLAQVILLRELTVAFYGVELITVISLGAWLLGTGAGALLRTGRFLPSARALLRLFLLLGFMVPFWVMIIRSLRAVPGAIPGTYLPFSFQLTALALVICPFSLCLGGLFQWTARHYARMGGTLARAYGIECIGGMVGGMLATALFWFGVQNFPAALLCGMLAAVWALAEARDSGTPDRMLSAAVIAILLVLSLSAPSLDQGMTRWSHPDLIVSRDSPYGRITITGRSGQVAVFENDVLSFETEGANAEALVHLAALQRPSVGKVLIIGGGVEGLVTEILKYHPDRVDYVEMNPVLPDMVKAWLPPSFGRALAAENVFVHTDDPVRFLKDAPMYDLILSGMPEPVSGASNRFYTREFFASCARRLGPGGILAFRLSAPENMWTRPMIIRNGGIHAALAQVFPWVRVLPAGAAVFLASGDPLESEPEALVRRFEQRGVAARLVSPEYLRYVYTHDRTARIERGLKDAGVPPNTDLRPSCYYHTGMIWLSKFFPGFINRPFLGAGGMAGAVWIAAAGLSACGVMIRRRPRLVGFAVVVIAGFSGMILETLLILAYQARAGALFQNMGLLFTLFMAGLGAGSLAVGRWLSSGPSPGQRISQPVEALRHRGALLLAALVGLDLVLAALLRKDGGTGAAGIAGLLFAAGFMVSGLVAFAGAFGVRDQEAVISPLYGADLIGGCLGSMLGGLVCVPLFGMDGTALWLAAVCGAGLWMFVPIRR